MLGIHNLTMNQKRVIVGLCLYPLQSDYDIAKKLSVKRSTFSTIRKNLVHSSALRPVNIPNFSMFNVELIAIDCFNLNPVMVKRFLKNNQSSLHDLNNVFPNIVTSTIDTDAGFSLLINKSLTDLMLAHNSYACFYHESRLSSSHDFHLFTAPSSEQGVINFMEYGKKLASIWEIPIKENSKDPPLISLKKDLINQISPIGWTVYKNLIKFPNKSTIELAAIIDKPRNTVARWLNFFQKNSCYITRYIPELTMVGIKIKSLHFISTQGLDPKEKSLLIQQIQNAFLPFNLYVSGREIAVCTIAKDYSSFIKTEKAFIKSIHLSNIPYSLVHRVVISIGNASILKEFDRSLSPLMEYLMESSQHKLHPFKDNTIFKSFNL